MKVAEPVLFGWLVLVKGLASMADCDLQLRSGGTRRPGGPTGRVPTCENHEGRPGREWRSLAVTLGGVLLFILGSNLGGVGPERGLRGGGRRVWE